MSGSPPQAGAGLFRAEVLDAYRRAPRSHGRFASNARPIRPRLWPALAALVLLAAATAGGLLIRVPVVVSGVVAAVHGDTVTMVVSGLSTDVHEGHQVLIAVSGRRLPATVASVAAYDSGAPSTGSTPSSSSGAIAPTAAHLVQVQLMRPQHVPRLDPGQAVQVTVDTESVLRGLLK